MAPATILKLLKQLNPAKSAGIDNLTGKFLKEGAPVLASPITDLVNLSISLPLFSDDCKIAKLKPLYKKEAKTEPKNYRPISLLPLLSKTRGPMGHILDRTIKCFRTIREQLPNEGKFAKLKPSLEKISAPPHGALLDHNDASTIQRFVQ